MPESVPGSEWPEALSDYWLDSARILAAESREDEKPGRDSLGTPGTVRRKLHRGSLGVRWPRGRVVRSLEKVGLRAGKPSSVGQELSLRRIDDDDPLADPFLLEDSVRVRVSGREFPGQQRAVIEAKVEALRREVDDPATGAKRKTRARGMIREMEDGLRSTVNVRAVVRRFRPQVSVDAPVASIGSKVLIEAGSRIVYSVCALDEEDREDDNKPMVFHVLAVGETEAILLCTGGLHWIRHLTDLDTSPVHHAWFANRERSRTDSVAPWVSRRVFSELSTRGRSEIVIRRRRDMEPVEILRDGEDTTTIRIDEDEVDVPVLLCHTACGDKLWILDDPESPLVLRLEEKGAEILRTVDRILTPSASGI